jgi:hypothetical protein
MKDMLQRLRISKTKTTPLHEQSDGMVIRNVKTVEEHLREVVSAHPKDWDKRLPIFLLVNRTLTHETAGTTPASMMLGTELRLPCDQLFGGPGETVVYGELRGCPRGSASWYPPLGPSTSERGQ